MNLKVVPVKHVKREIYNLKNVQDQFRFKKSTEDTQDFYASLNISDSVVLNVKDGRKIRTYI